MRSTIFWVILSTLWSAAYLHAHELVNIAHINPRICLHIQDNTCKGAYLVRHVAKQLNLVQKELEKDCIGLVVLAAYRPYSYAQYFATPYALIPHDECNPLVNGHYRGTAVDVTICYMDGQPLEMPPLLNIHELKELGSDYHGFSCNAYHNLQRLQKAMEKHRFVSSPTEWWHFDYKDWFQYPVLDIPFEELILKPVCQPMASI